MSDVYIVVYVCWSEIIERACYGDDEDRGEEESDCWKSIAMIGFIPMISINFVQ